jgi:predicted DNA-binding protein with PD1-like motif
MDYSVGTTGRTVVLRLHDGEAIYPAIESVAQKENIKSAVVWIIGGMKNATVVVGPKDASSIPLETMQTSFSDEREIVGVGTLFINVEGLPKLHLHAGIGKGASPIVGCPRKGADCWLVDEVIMLELINVKARRVKQGKCELELLEVQ